MSLLHLGLWFLGALVTAIIAYAVLRSSIHVLFYELVSEKVAAAFVRALYCGLYVMAILPGVGYLSKGYRGFAKTPETTFEWFATFYNAMAASGTAIFSYLGVIFFTLLVLHVGLIRCQITSGSR